MLNKVKRILAGLVLLSLVLGVAAPAWAADTASVTATVTPQVIAVSIEDGTVDYGILAAGETNNTFDGEATADTQTISNGSNVSANIALRSSDAYVVADTTDWALAGTAGTNQFAHSYDINASGSASWATFPANGTFGNINTSTVVTLDASDGVYPTATLDLKIDMPTSITNTSAHSIDVTVLATEA